MVAKKQAKAAAARRQRRQRPPTADYLCVVVCACRGICRLQLRLVVRVKAADGAQAAPTSDIGGSLECRGRRRPNRGLNWTDRRPNRKVRAADGSQGSCSARMGGRNNAACVLWAFKARRVPSAVTKFGTATIPPIRHGAETLGAPPAGAGKSGVRLALPAAPPAPPSADPRLAWLIARASRALQAPAASTHSARNAGLPRPPCRPPAPVHAWERAAARMPAFPAAPGGACWPSRTGAAVGSATRAARRRASVPCSACSTPASTGTRSTWVAARRPAAASSRARRCPRRPPSASRSAALRRTTPAAWPW